VGVFDNLPRENDLGHEKLRTLDLMTQGYNRASPATIHTHELENNQESHRNREHSTSCRDEENRTATGGGYQPLCCSPWRDGRDFELQRGQTRAKREAARNHEGGIDAGARDLRQITPGPATAQSRGADKKNRHEGVALQERPEPQTLAWKKTKEGRPMAARFRESKTRTAAPLREKKKETNPNVTFNSKLNRAGPQTTSGGQQMNTPE
jgi:hypothetical protein